MSKNEGKHPQGNWVSIGISIGVAFGAALGTALDNLGVGIGAGLTIGAGIGEEETEAGSFDRTCHSTTARRDFYDYLIHRRSMKMSSNT